MGGSQNDDDDEGVAASCSISCADDGGSCSCWVDGTGSSCAVASSSSLLSSSPHEPVEKILQGLVPPAVWQGQYNGTGILW